MTYLLALLSWTKDRLSPMNWAAYYAGHDSLWSYRIHLVEQSVKRHKLTMTRRNGGIQYACSCGWSQGFQPTKKDARRKNKAAHDDAQ